MAASIGHYDILGTVGTGGHGTVYRARDTRVGRTVAIRVLGDEATDPWRRTHFLENVRPFTALSHPHVATLFEVGEHGGRAYLVYEFVPGEKLSALAAGHPLNLRRALDLAIQLADALAEAHSAGLVHGGLTPSSVIVTPKGHAKILDVGLPAWQDDRDAGDPAARIRARQAALGEGSVPYMSPEQVLGHAVDHRSDIFSLGTIIYELLTGRSPFLAASSAGVGERVVQGSPGPPGRVNLEVPEAVDQIVVKALASSPDDRYADVAILASDLRAASSAVHARDGEAIEDRAETRGSAHPVLRIGVLTLLLAAAVAAAAWQFSEPIKRAWQSYFGPPFSPVLAVMPFEVAAVDATHAHLGPGLAEELSTRLGHIPGVTVLGRSSLRSFAGRDPRAVAGELRASLAVTARVTPQDETWRELDIRVTLVSPDTGEGVWTKRYPVVIRDLLAAQAKIAEDIAIRLAVPFTPTPGLRRAGLRLVQPDALDAYLQARTAMAELDTNRAVRLYESALEADPGLVEARAGLSQALHASAVFEHRVGYPDIERRMRQTAAEAFTADPDLAHSELAMGLASRSADEALEHIRRAIALDASDTAIYLAAGALVRDFDPALALRFLSWARALDPGLPRVRFEAAAADLVVNQPDQTLVETARGQALAPSLPWWDALRLRARLAGSGTISETLPDDTRSLPGFPPGAVIRAQALMAAGQRDAAIGAATGVVRLFPGFCEARALLAGLLHETNRAESARLAAAIYTAAESAPAAMARCAVMVAGATEDPRRAASWIDRAATAPAGPLLWGRVNGVLSPQAGIRQRVYPWAGVLDNAQVSAAAARLDAALARLRTAAARAFEGLESPVPQADASR